MLMIATHKVIVEQFFFSWGVAMNNLSSNIFNSFFRFFKTNFSKSQIGIHRSGNLIAIQNSEKPTQLPLTLVCTQSPHYGKFVPFIVL